MDSALHAADALYYGLAAIGVVYTLFIVSAKICNERRRWWTIQYYRRASLDSISSGELITTIAELEQQADAESRRGTFASIFNWRLNKPGRLSEDWAFIPANSKDSHPLNFLKTKQDSKIQAAENSGAIPKRSPTCGYSSNAPAEEKVEADSVETAEKAPSTDSSCEEEDYLSRSPCQPIPQYCILENGVKMNNIHSSRFIKPYTYFKSTETGKEQKGSFEKVAEFILGKEKRTRSKSSESSLSRLFQFGPKNGSGSSSAKK